MSHKRHMTARSHAGGQAQRAAGRLIGLFRQRLEKAHPVGLTGPPWLLWLLTWSQLFGSDLPDFPGPHLL